MDGDNAVGEEGCCACIGGLDSEQHVGQNPKDFFANERNFIHWMHMAVTMGSVASLISAIGKHEDVAHRRGSLATSSVLLLAGCTFAIYALCVFFMRRRSLATRHGSVDEPYGPLILSTLLGLSLTMILFTACVPIL
mmetsp:Transcript_36383/g.74668  ORF Transcript_36383/g.74668 Transcript_36383/m.74668 type:complete len:137 (+) Transcript_36383:1-411(+)